MADAHDPVETYVHLSDGPEAVPLRGGEQFWATLDQQPVDDGRIVCAFEFDADWESWERHPAGEEIVCLLAGSMDLVVDDGESERTVPLRGNELCIVPQGAWHRAIVHEPSRALFITRGEGTEHRPYAP